MLERLAAECDWCTEFGVRVPDATSSTMSLLSGTKKGLTSYDVVSCDVQSPQRLAAASGKMFRFNVGSSLDVEIEPTDLLMIDSLHTYWQLKQELELHSEKVRKYIVMHDTALFGTHGEDGTIPGLWQAIVEFLETNLAWRLEYHTTECCGLTVLRRE